MSLLRSNGLPVLLFALALTLPGCAPGGGPAAPSRSAVVSSIFDADLSARQPRAASRGPEAVASLGRRGTGAAVYAGADPSGGGQSISSYAPGEINLNFQNADLREVIQAILGDALKLNYTVDPTVAGTVTMSSARPVAEDDLLPILETVLRMNGAALVREGGNYSIVPEASAVSGRGDVGQASPGYGISILPLRYTSAQTLVSLIDGFGTRPGSVRAETARNLLLVLGNSADRQAAMETAMSFDADWMQDQTVAILPLENAKPESVIQELNRIFKSSEGGLGAELVQFIPMARLRAVLVVSPQKDIIARARTWVERLDSENPDLKADVYVYRVKYREARKLATLLTQLFSSTPTTGDSPADQVEPGARPVASEGFGDGFSEDVPGGTGGSGEGEAGTTPENPVLVGSEPVDNTTPASGTGPRIQADISNNSIVIYADLETRQRILSALSSLDVPQIQVAINVTMAEIQLTEDLQYGVQFFLQNKKVGSLGFFGAAAQTISRTTPGFNLLLGSENSPELIINAFDRITDVQVLSSPSLVVVENEIARFQVGDEIPIITRRVQEPGGSDNGLVTSNEVEYRDTGIILSVKPRVSDNGLVAMTIEQEISSVSSASADLTPTISKRKVSSSISVADGQTVLLGGLISEQHGSVKSGLPGLNRTKVLRNLLGSTDRERRRTELIILIRPTVIYEGQDAQKVAEDLRSKMYSLGANQAR